MALYYNLPIYKSCYDLLQDLYSLTRHFNREFKYTLGQEMKNSAMQMVLYVFKANSAVNREPFLDELSDRFEILKLQVRLCVDMHLISASQHAKLWEKMEGIGKQLTGWKKANQRRSAGGQ
jgi:hypothetical protein